MPTFALRKRPSPAHICTATESISRRHLRHHCCPPRHLPLRNTAAQHTVLQPHALCCNRVPPVNDPAADGTCCNRLHAAALPCHWLHPIRSNPSEARAPLAESRGVCAALWTRIGFDVSEAVPLTAPSIPAATGSRDSVDVRATGFCSEQSRPTSALRLGLGLGLRVGQRTRANHRPTALRRLPRGDGASRSVSRGGTLLAAGEGCRGCPHWCRATAALPGPGRIRGGGLCPLGMALGRRRGARKTAKRRAVSLGRRLRGASTDEVEARETKEFIFLRNSQLATRKQNSRNVACVLS